MKKKKIIKQKSKLTFGGTHKSFENCISYSFKQNEVKRDRPFYLGFAVLELSKLHMYKTYHDKLQPFFGQENIQIHYIDTDAFVLSMNTKYNLKDLKHFADVFDFSNLDRNQEIFSNNNKRFFGKHKIETPSNYLG